MVFRNSLFLLYATILLVFALNTFGQSAGVRVFVVQSREKGSYSGDIQLKSLLTKLSELGFPNEKLNIKIHYMAADSRNRAVKNDESGIALAQIGEFKPKVLITVGDPAFEHVGLRYAMTKLPVIFTGLKGQPEKYNQLNSFMDTRRNPGKNVTGIYEDLHVVDAIKFHLKILPETKKILIITDKSVTGKAVAKQAMLELQGAGLKCICELISVRSWEEYTKRVADFSNSKECGALYPAVERLVDDKGNPHELNEIIEWTLKNNSKPELILSREFALRGYLGGLTVDQKVMGEQAAEMVADVLKGANPGKMPIKQANKTITVFNVKRAEKLSIQIPETQLEKSELVGE